MSLYPLPEKYKNLKSLVNNNTYRFGDVLGQLQPAWERCAIDILLNKEKFSDSILYEYLDQVGLYTRPIDYFRLDSIALKKCKKNKFRIPKADDIVVHLRLGDVAETNFPFGIDNLKNIYFNYFKDFEVYPYFKKVIISTALSYGSYESIDIYKPSKSSWQNSLELLDVITNELDKKNIKWEIHSSISTDEEFCFLINSKYLIISGSNFSYIASKCISKRKIFFDEILWQKIRSIPVDWRSVTPLEEKVNTLSKDQIIFKQNHSSPSIVLF